MTQRRWRRLAGLLCVGASLFAAGIEDAAAATRQWDGSSSALWSDPANWVGDVAPVNGDDLLFPVFASNLTNQNDIPGLQVNSIVFLFQNYVFTGQPITIGAGGMTLSSGATISWGLATTLSAAQTWTLENGAQLTNTGTLNLSGRALTFNLTGPFVNNGEITGAGSLIKTGTGNAYFSVANSYTGITQINGGYIIASHPSALGVSDSSFPNGTVVNGGTLALADGVALAAEALTLNGSGQGEFGALWVVNSPGGNASVAGPITLASDITVQVPTLQTLSMLGVIAGAGGIRLVGNGTLVLASTTLAFAGDLAIGANAPSTGTIRLGNPAAVLPNRIDVSMPYAGSTLDLNGAPTQLGSISGAGNLALGAATLTIEQELDVTYTGVFSGTGSFAKYGQGRLAMTGTHTLTGNAQVYAGTMALIGGSMPANVSAAVGGTLSLVSNPQLGPLSVGSNGVIALDEGGPQIARSLNFHNSASGNLRVTTSNAATNPCSQLRVTGTVTLGGTLAVTTVPDAAPAPGSTCTIIDNDGTDPVAGIFSGLPEGALLAGGSLGFRVSYAGGDGNDVTLTATSRKYYLSEGATGEFFDLDILLANPNDEAVPVELTFLREPNITPVTQTLELAPLSRRTVRVDDIAGLQNAAVSAVVTSMNGLPIMVERTMRWDSTGYGAHTDKASDGPAVKWYFAEGSQGFFDTFILLSNPTNEYIGADIEYLLDNAPPVQGGGGVDPLSRSTLWAGDISGGALRNQSFGFVVTFTKPGIAERSMYFGNPARLWEGGHESAGVNELSTTWFLAEGATGPFFETFVLLANPNPAPADVTLRFLPATGVPVTVNKKLEGRSRLTVNIEGEHPTLSNVPVATQVTSTEPIVVERAQYWPDPASTWYEAHNSFGVTQLGTRWGLAEGRVGGPGNYQTYILLANPGTAKATVTIQFLRASGVPVTKTFDVDPASRYNVSVGPGTPVPELENEEFGAVITSTQPLAVERALYSDANGQVWAAGTNATAVRLP